jgi:hypothetical protein
MKKDQVLLKKAHVEFLKKNSRLLSADCSLPNSLLTLFKKAHLDEGSNHYEISIPFEKQEQLSLALADLLLDKGIDVDGENTNLTGDLIEEIIDALNFRK